ncbi:MAG: hypothetical protein WC958_03935 [Dehalococcoidales bacterium]
MKKQTIMWTALPDGAYSITGRLTNLRLSVFVAPRLETDDKNATLSAFPDFLDWPATLFPTDGRRSVMFSVQFKNGETTQAAIVSELPSSQLWQALFDKNTRIHPYEMQDFKNMPIQSFPVKNIEAFFKKQYIDLATTSGGDFPTASELFVNEDSPFRPLAFSYRDKNEEQLTNNIMNELKRHGYVSAGSSGDPAEITKSFLQAKLFHKPFNAKRVTLEPPAIDFHKAISILADYPYLLRRLGLVFDLVAALPPQTASENTVQVLATWMPGMPDFTDVVTVNIPDWDRKMATRCYVDSSSFYSLSRVGNPEIVDRMLPFEDQRRYHVTAIDVDGSAIKAINFASNLTLSHSTRRSADTPEKISLPSLRSAGISVARIDKAEQTHETFERQDDLNQNFENGSDMLLSAEDLTRGFVIDVWDSLTNKWHSLCRRAGTYEFLKPSSAIVERHEDEGWISQGVTSAADDSSDILRQGESLFHWNGWSLSAPRPGKTIDPDGSPNYTGKEIDPDFKLGVEFKPVPGSLPRLRYGITYRFRARAVDLAGNRLSLDNKYDDKHATEPLVYGRFEPVPTPVTVMRKQITEGESVDHIVIRSNFNTPFEAVSERHIVPPKSAQSLAETHRLFDDPESGAVDKNAYKVIVPRESGVIAGKPDPDNHDLPFVDEDEIELPYLPDIFSRQAVFNGLPGGPQSFPVSFGYSEGAKWPYALPFRLVLTEGEKAHANFYEKERVFEVVLPKAEVLKVKLSSGMTKDDIWQMGLIQWIIEEGKDETPSVVLALEGKHWMLTPYRTLTLVHAVRQPLLTPEFGYFSFTRAVGQTFAHLYDRMMRVHLKSTVKIDLKADWTENIDPLGEAGPRVISVSAHPFDNAVNLPAANEEEDIFYLQGNHEFSDTKYRKVTYSAIATTRFAEYFRKRIKNVKLSGDAPFTLSSEKLVEGSESVRLADNSAGYKAYDAESKDGDYVVDYNTAALRRTNTSEKSSAIPENTNLEVAFIEKPITRETESPFTLDILSAARPAAPKILYVIPTFSWEASSGGGSNTSVVSNRIGGGIRIYMERPWYSSGDGELLGAVLWPGPSSISISKDPAHEKIKPFVTQWGLDPLFLSAPIPALPTLNAFKLSKKEYQASGLLLEEVHDANLKVNIAGHEVAYDSDRKLWYCDMQIDAGKTYFPFVRLALVRYQPNSLSTAITGPDTFIDPNKDNVHLSRVVLADFIQLAPDRFAGVTRDDSASDVRHITVSGPGYSKTVGYEGHAVVEVSLEKMRDGIDPEVAGELAWEPLNQNPVVLTHQFKQPEKDGDSVWTGDIKLPDAKNVYRLVIKEFEVFNVSGLTAIYQRRLVYADTIVLRP